MTERATKLPVSLAQVRKACVLETLHNPAECDSLAARVSLKSNPDGYCQAVVTLSHARTEFKDGNFLVIGTCNEEIRNNPWPICNFIKILFSLPRQDFLTLEKLAVQLKWKEESLGKKL